MAAVEACGFAKREDFYWALHSVFVRKRAHREIFDQAFHVFWRNPRILARLMQVILPTTDLPVGSNGNYCRMSETTRPG